MKLVVLDRDGVINLVREETVTRVEDFEPIAGSLDAIALLGQNGYRVAVATNQSGLARGLLNLDTLNAIHRRMQELVHSAGGHLDVVAVCPHGESEECDCRKPNPGMLYSVAERLEVPLDQAWLVGDSLKDMQAAMAAGMRAVLVRSGHGANTLERHKGLEQQVRVHQDLLDFVTTLLAHSETEVPS